MLKCMSGYKETSFGIIPKEWNVYKFKDVLKIKGRIGWKGYKTSDLRSEGPAVIGGVNIKSNINLDYKNKSFLSREKFEESPEIMLKKGDVLLVTRGNGIGDVALFNGEVSEATINPSVVILSDYKGDPRFLYYFVVSPQGNEQIMSLESGSSIPALYQGLLKTIELPFPDLTTQSKISDVLESLDKKNRLLTNQNATLEKIAETLFRQWFVEPISEFSTSENLIAGFTNGKFVQWISETVGGEWGKEVADGDFNKAVFCIRGTDIADLNVGLPERTPIRYVKESKFKNIEPQEGDLIIEISGGTESQSTGRVCYINNEVKSLFKYPLVFSNFCRMIRVKRPEYSFFLYCYFQYLYKQDEFFNLENGSSGIKNLDYKALLFELEYPMPEEQMIIKFHLQVEPLFKKVNQNKSQIRTLTALRDSLLPKLMSGELRVEMKN